MSAVSLSKPSEPGPQGGGVPTPAPERPKPSAFTRRNFVETVLQGYVPLVIATIIMVLPLLWMIVSSFKIRGEIVTVPIHWLPGSFYTGNYVDAAEAVPIWRMFANSVIVTAIGASIKVVLAILSAYALVFIKFPFKRVVFVVILVALMVPPQVTLVPNYTLIANLGGQDTYWGIILPGLGTAFGTFLLRQQFMAVPPSIVEAAQIDGASHWRALWQVIVPVSAPAIATVGLVSVVNEWNDYLWPLVITNDPGMKTLPAGLALLQNTEPGATQWGMLMAGAALVILPILIVFAMLQRYIVEGLTQGAVTG
ncbi:carbohydrate ABC transporter permease [Micrococcales bacterium 31B]|nr:carbohydrate ABC transporter permease [Micrococcales bacterium 31B]